MANRVVRDEIYYARFENNTDVINSTDPVVQAELAQTDADGLGANQFVLYEDMVNDYMATHTGDNSIVGNPPKWKVERHAKKAIQQLSYDTLRGVGSLEYELVDNLSVAVPQDTVSIYQVSYLDASGYLRPMQERRFSGNPNAYMQDDDGNYTYRTGGANDGERIQQTPSTTLTRYNDSFNERQDPGYNDYIYGSSINYEIYTSYYFGYGRRYGGRGEVANGNGTYFYDPQEGIIYFDSTLMGEHVVIEYVTDGLSNDTSQIKIHKFAEEAVYAFVNWKLATQDRRSTRGEKEMTRREWFNEKRRAKIRGWNINHNQIVWALRTGTQWIKT